MQKIKDFVYKHFAYLFIVISALCICGGVYLFHVSGKLYHHDDESVQHVEAYNIRATDAVQCATDKIAATQAKLSRTSGKLERAVGRTQELQRGIISNTGIIDECQDRLNRCQELLSSAEGIYKDIERGDKRSREN